MFGCDHQEARVLAWLRDFEVGVHPQPARLGVAPMEAIPEEDEGFDQGFWGPDSGGASREDEDEEDGQGTWASSVDELLSEVVQEYLVSHPPRRRGFDFGESPHSMRMANELRSMETQEKLDTMGKKHKRRIMRCLSVVSVCVGLAATVTRG